MSFIFGAARNLCNPLNIKPVADATLPNFQYPVSNPQGYPNMANCMPYSTPSVPSGDYGVYTKGDARRDRK